MKKRNVILQAAIAAALVSTIGLAQAGSVTGSSITFASEAVGASTQLTLGPVVYNLGVPRTTTQPFTIIYTLTGTSNPTFFSTPAIPTAAGGTCAIAGSSLKRGGAGSNQVVYDIQVSGDCATGNTLTLVSPVITSANATSGITVQLLTQSETACVDNAGSITTCIVPSTPRASLVSAVGFGTPALLAAPPNDTATVINVNNSPVPLAGFVVDSTSTPVNGRDSALIAKAVVAITNTTTGAKNAGGTVDFTMAAGDLVTLTVTDVTGFLGLATNGLCFDRDASAQADGTTNLCTAGEVFTISGNTGTLAGIPGNSGGFNGVAQTLSYTANGVDSLGTSRVLGITGAVAPTTSGGSAHGFNNNASFWQWSSNGVVLQAPLFQNTPGYITRFALTNTGSVAATYSAVVRTESGNTCTAGTGASGSIPANGQLIVNGLDLCTSFTGAPRGAAIFTVNAPSASIQGATQLVYPNTGSVTTYVMIRPGTN